jgi:hypothetical protein
MENKVLDDHVKMFMRVLDVGIEQGTVFTASSERLSVFRDHFLKRLQSESIRVIPIDLSGRWLAETADASEIGSQDLILLWGLECLSPQESRAYSLRSTLDTMKFSGGPRFVIFCDDCRYRDHFNNYDAPFYQFCLRIPVC